MNRPGPPEVVLGGPAASGAFALTVDDGTRPTCAAEIVAAAQRSGFHLTLCPNGNIGPPVWNSQADAIAAMAATGQLAICNHTWNTGTSRPWRPPGSKTSWSATKRGFKSASGSRHARSSARRSEPTTPGSTMSPVSLADESDPVERHLRRFDRPPAGVHHPAAPVVSQIRDDHAEPRQPPRHRVGDGPNHRHRGAVEAAPGHDPRALKSSAGRRVGGRG